MTLSNNEFAKQSHIRGEIAQRIVYENNEIFECNFSLRILYTLCYGEWPVSTSSSGARLSLDQIVSLCF